MKSVSPDDIEEIMEMMMYFFIPATFILSIVMAYFYLSYFTIKDIVLIVICYAGLYVLSVYVIYILFLIMLTIGMGLIYGFNNE